MGKNIIFCADGTWNGPGEDKNLSEEPAGTNVFKLFCNLAGDLSPDTTRLKDEQESALRDQDRLLQCAKYIHGVGDSDNFLVKAMGGALGAGTISRILRGYTFVSRNYVPDDFVFLIGFSRGAYTARALADFIANKGLLDPTKIDLADKENAYRLAAAVWSDYRREALRQSGNLLGRFEEVLVDLPGFLTRPPTDKLVIIPKIRTVAVWDTVGALGIPEYVLSKDERRQAVQFTSTNLSAKVELGFHAISIDEQRADFTPTLWTPRTDTSIQQRLFPGAHADVGGGYPIEKTESGLSDGALQWMTDNLRQIGVHFSGTPAYPTKPNPCGTAHAPWMSPPWNAVPRGARHFPNWLMSNCDPSVDARRQGGLVRADPAFAPSLYQPQNLT